MTDEPDDIVETQSSAPFAETIERVAAAIEKAGLMIFARIDHAAGAKSIGADMPPTVVLIYGTPAGGTPIMQAAPRAALDLPLRALVRETDGGQVLVAFHPIAPVMRKAGAPDALAARLEPAQRLLMDAVR